MFGSKTPPKQLRSRCTRVSDQRREKHGALFHNQNGPSPLGDGSHEADGRLRLRWMETGGPVRGRNLREKGLGSRIIEQMIVQQKGKVSL